MGSGTVLGVGTVAVRSLLAADAVLMAAVGSRLYPNADGDRPERDAYPYASVESSSELSMNTMGQPNALKWGSIASIWVRLGSLSRSEAEIASLLNLVKADLDGQKLSLSGYGAGHAILEFAGLQIIEDTMGGRKVREWLVSFDLTAHQEAA